jgi:hypothetical protein
MAGRRSWLRLLACAGSPIWTVPRSALLMLRDKAQVARKTVSLACAPGTVRDIINVAKFEKLFELE